MVTRMKGCWSPGPSLDHCWPRTADAPACVLGWSLLSCDQCRHRPRGWPSDPRCGIPRQRAPLCPKPWPLPTHWPSRTHLGCGARPPRRGCGGCPALDLSSPHRPSGTFTLWGQDGTSSACSHHHPLSLFFPQGQKESVVHLLATCPGFSLPQTRSPPHRPSSQ